MKRKTVLLCFFFIMTLLLTSCKASEESLILAKSIPQTGESVILTAKYYACNEWYSFNSNEDSVSAQIYTSGAAETVKLGGVRQSGAILNLEPLKKGDAKITVLYSSSPDNKASDATMYRFDVNVTDDLEVTCTPIIPAPSIALGLDSEDGSYWELISCDSGVEIMDAAYIESNTDDEVDAICYFPVIPVSEGTSKADFVLKDAGGAQIQQVTYSITVNSDMSVSLKIP